FRDNEKKKPDKRMVGTTDYLAPEQVVDSDEVDIRADIYGLGATFYFLLTGKTPFEDQSIAHQKLISHLARSAKPIRDFRSDVPEELEAIVRTMLAKNPWDRYPTPAVVADVLEPWTRQPIPPPSPQEMPRFCPAARRIGQLDDAAKPPKSGVGLNGSWVVRRGDARQAADSGLLSDPSRLPATEATKPTRNDQTTDAVKPASAPATPPPRPERPESANSTVNVDPDANDESGPSSSFYQACLTPESATAPPNPKKSSSG
ncbi:MAG TPA: hypothetical protein VKI65_18800, partial [Gemmataceae bacterium]|nr:hypothetical protein [Gemmataceae bacterium]